MGQYIEATCKHCGSRGYLRDSIWLHAWGSQECGIRPVFEPDFAGDRLPHH